MVQEHCGRIDCTQARRACTQFDKSMEPHETPNRLMIRLRQRVQHYEWLSTFSEIKDYTNRPLQNQEMEDTMMRMVNQNDLFIKKFDKVDDYRHSIGINAPFTFNEIEDKIFDPVQIQVVKRRGKKM